MDHDLAISVGTTELVEEAEQVHDELHNVGLGGITVQMDVLDAPKTAGQAVSRSTVNNRGWLLKIKQANVELESKHSESSKKSSKYDLPFPFFYYLHMSLKRSVLYK